VATHSQKAGNWTTKGQEWTVSFSVTTKSRTCWQNSPYNKEIKTQTNRDNWYNIEKQGLALIKNGALTFGITIFLV